MIATIAWFVMWLIVGGSPDLLGASGHQDWLVALAVCVVIDLGMAFSPESDS